MVRNKSNAGSREKRAQARREADWHIKAGFVQRAPLTPDLYDSFFKSIDNNCCSEFGVVKLSKLDLNQLVPSPEKLSWEPQCTVLAYASFRNRTEIAQKLMRGGAQWLQRCCVMAGETGESAPSHHSDGRPCNAATPDPVLEAKLGAYWRSFGNCSSRYTSWMVREVSHMRKAGVLAVTSEEYSDANGVVGRCCAVCTKEVCQPIVFRGCEHLMCERCLWVGAAGDSNHDRELKCPVCGHSSEVTAEEEAETERLRRLAERDSGCEGRKAASLASFEALPDRPSPADQKEFRKETKLRSAPLRQLKAMFIGSIKEGRLAAWHEAAARGDTVRLRILLEAGVDVEGENEYGHTALFIATMHGRAAAVRFLAGWAGADVDHAAGGGCTPLGTAVTNGTAEVVAALQQFGATLSYGMSDGFLDGEHSANLTVDQLTVTQLIPPDSEHPGRGALMVDGAFDGPLLDRLDALWRSLPVAPPQKLTCSDRMYYCDSEGWVAGRIAAVMALVRNELGESYRQHECDFPCRALSMMRFLCYREVGGALAPHIDLSRTEGSTGQRSAYTFIVYTEDCDEGGETVLLHGLGDCGSSEGTGDLAAVTPRRGRLLLFPHVCPHRGAEVRVVPKVLIRGEVMAD